MTTYEQLVNMIRKHVPNVTERVHTNTDLDSTANDYNPHSCRVRPITLEDVILSASKRLHDDYDIYDMHFGVNILTFIDNNGIEINWRLNKPLHEQSEETQTAILELIKQ